MKKSIVGLLLLGIALGTLLGYWRAPKGDPLAELLPAEKLEGYIEATKVALISNAQGQNITGGTLLLAEGWAPDGIPEAKLLPTVYGVLKAVLQQNRGADKIRLYLAEDSLLARAYQWAAIAEYDRGRILVTGGYPTPAEIDSLKKLGLDACRPELADRKALAEIFDKTGGLAAARLAYSQSLTLPQVGEPKDNHFQLPLETPVLGRAGKTLGLKPQAMREKVLAINRFYWLKAGKTLAVLE